jgi:hypothetical protein
MLNATNGFSLGLNWTAGKLPAVNDSKGSSEVNRSLKSYDCNRCQADPRYELWLAFSLTA